MKVLRNVDDQRHMILESVCGLFSNQEVIIDWPDGIEQTIKAPDGGVEGYYTLCFEVDGDMDDYYFIEEWA